MRNSKGQWMAGPDPTRHPFTKAECQEGFWAAIESIIARYPDAVDGSGRHMACDFLINSGRHNGLGQKKRRKAKAKRKAEK